MGLDENLCRRRCWSYESTFGRCAATPSWMIKAAVFKSLWHPIVRLQTVCWCWAVLLVKRILMRNSMQEVCRVCWSTRRPLRLHRPTVRDPSSVTPPVATSVISRDNVELNGEALDPLACGTRFVPASLVSFYSSPDASSFLSVLIVPFSV